MQDIKELIRLAFMAAREKGKSDWHLMQIAVLKNRLLQMTGGAFDVSGYGYLTFRDLIRENNDLVRINPDDPRQVEWIESHKFTQYVGSENLSGSQNREIRPDLWRAIMDFASGNLYIWDASKGVARETSIVNGAKLLPTLNQETLHQWRAEFANSHAEQVSDEAGKQKLGKWLERGLGTNALPYILRAPWTSYLKASVIDRLKSWFKDQGIPLPNLAEIKTHASVTSDLDALRRMVIDCVSLMTKEELDALKLPVSAIARAKSSGK